jgi:TP901 family phage tail tape measure protein
MAIRKVTEEVLSIRVQGVDAATRKYGKLAGQQDRLERETKQATRAVKQQKAAMASISGGLINAQAAANLAALAFVAMRRAIQAIKAPVNLAIDFEKNFAMIKTLSSDVNESVRQDLLTLASNVPQTAADVTKAAYQAISAGISTSDLIPFLKAASDVAVGGATSMTSAVNLLSSAVNAWELQGMNAKDAADSFFTTVRLGKTTIEELNASLGRGAAVAQMGVSLDTLNAGIALLTKQGVPTAEAMTKMVAMIKLLANPTADAVKKFRFLNVEIGINAIKNKGLEGVLADLQEKTLGSTAVLGTMSRRMEANSALLGLLGNNYSGFNKLLGEYKDKTGAAANATNIMNDTTQGAINRFNALKEDVLRRLGEKVLPMVNEALEAMYTWLLAYGDEVIETTAGVFQSLYDLGKWLKDNGDVITTTIKVMFGTAALLGFVQAMALVKAAWVTGMAAMAASGSAGLMSKLLLGIQAAAAGGPWVIAVVGVFTAVGLLIGKAMGKSAAERAAEELERFKEQSATEIRRLEQQRRLTGRSSESDDAFQEQLVGGDRLMFAAQAFGFDDPKKMVEQMRKREIGEYDKPLTTYTPLKPTQIDRPYGTGQMYEVEGAVGKYKYETARAWTQATFPGDQAAPDMRTRLKQWINMITNDQAFAEWRMATLEGLHELPTVIKKGKKVITQTQNRALSSLEKEEKILHAALGEIGQEVEFEAKKRGEAKSAFDAELRKLNAHHDSLRRTYHKAAQEFGPGGGDTPEARQIRADIQHQMDLVHIQRTKVLQDRDDFIKSGKRLNTNFFRLQMSEVERVNSALKESDESRRTRLKAQSERAKLEKDWSAKFISKTDKAADEQGKIAEREAQKRGAFIEKQTQTFEALMSQYTVAAVTEGELARGKGKGAPTPMTKQQYEETTRAGVSMGVVGARYEAQKVAKAANDSQIGVQQGRSGASVPLPDMRIRKMTERERINAQFMARKDQAQREFDALPGTAAEKADAKAALDKQIKAAEIARDAAHNDKKLQLEIEANQRMLALDAGQSGSRSAAAISALDLELEAKKQMYQEYGIATVELEQRFARERISLARAERHEITQAIRMSQGQVAQSIGATIGAVKEVAAAAEASTEVMGILEAGQITAMGVYHGFMAGSSFAQAAYAGAKALVPGPQAAVFAAQASAFTAAGVMHSVQAAAAGAQAGMALYSGFKGESSSASGGGGVSQYDTSEPAGVGSLADRQTGDEQRGGISFGDIVLSDVPALFSNEGVDYLGEQITQSIVDAMNRNSAIPGYGRFNERSFRRRGG